MNYSQANNYLKGWLKNDNITHLLILVDIKTGDAEFTNYYLPVLNNYTIIENSWNILTGLDSYFKADGTVKNRFKDVIDGNINNYIQGVAGNLYDKCKNAGSDHGILVLRHFNQDTCEHHGELIKDALVEVHNRGTIYGQKVCPKGWRIISLDYFDGYSKLLFHPEEVQEQFNDYIQVYFDLEDWLENFAKDILNPSIISFLINNKEFVNHNSFTTYKMFQIEEKYNKNYKNNNKSNFFYKQIRGFAFPKEIADQIYWIYTGKTPPKK